MSKIVEFKIGKGKTSRPSQAEEWTCKYLELTVRLPDNYREEDFQESLVRAKYVLDNWVEQPETSQIPDLDIAKIDSLPWKKRNKEPAKVGEFGWLFGPGSRDGTEAGAEALAKALKATKEGSLVLGDMQYSLVKDGIFIQRKPVKR